MPTLDKLAYLEPVLPQFLHANMIASASERRLRGARHVDGKRISEER